MSISQESGGVSRWLPLTGLVFVVIVVVPFAAIQGDTPESESSAAKVVSFYNEHQDSQFVTAFLLAGAAPFLVFFGVNLALALWPPPGERDPRAGRSRRRERDRRAGLHHGRTRRVRRGRRRRSPHAGGAQALNVLDSDSWIVFNSGLGVMMLGAAASLLPRRPSGRFLGWSALVLGIALFIPFADFFALALSGIWIIVVSIMQFRGSPALAPAAA